MPTPIEQALVTLLPTLTTLPQELLDLSTSLLTQSRSKAATLKPDEEIGRVFACAHIAVDRLKHRLDVDDDIVARPPVPPRIYKKLYGYLDSALTPSTPRSNRLKDLGGTPGSRGRRSVTGTPSRGLREEVRSADATPRKTPVSAAKTSAKDTSGRRTRTSLVEEKEGVLELPKQARPMISTLGAALGAPEAEAHVTAALAAILPLCGWSQRSAPTTRKRKRGIYDEPVSKPRRNSHRVSIETVQTSPMPEADAEEEEGNADAETEPITPSTLPLLLISLTLLTTFTLQNTPIDTKAYNSLREKAISSFQNLDSGVEIEDEIDAFLHRAKREGWLDMEWFADVKAAASASASASAAAAVTTGEGKSQAKTPLRRREKHAVRPSSTTTKSFTEIMEEEKEEEEEGVMDIDGTDVSGSDGHANAGLKWGLGTMFQDSVDWLSFERRKGFRGWERRVRRRCAEIDGA